MTVPNGELIRRSLRVQSTVSLLLAGGLLLVCQVAAYSSMFGSLAAFIPALVNAVGLPVIIYKAPILYLLPL